MKKSSKQSVSNCLRDRQLYCHYLVYGNLTLAGEVFGISPVRAQQIIKRMIRINAMFDQEAVLKELQTITKLLLKLTKILNVLNWETLVQTIKEASK